MYLTNLNIVQRILPRHLEGVVDEVERQVVMKGWFLDDALPIGDKVLSAAQRFFRSAGSRRWLDVTTGDLLTLFLLDTNLPATMLARLNNLEKPPEDIAVDILIDHADPSAFIRATHEVASTFDIRLDALPALVLYSSQRDYSSVVVSFRGLKTEQDVKDRCALVIQEVHDAAVDVFGPTRTDALVRRSGAPPITEDEAQQILRRINTSINGKHYGDWLTIITGANAISTLLEHIIKILKHFA
jgi:hypothetical protein